MASCKVSSRCLDREPGGSALEIMQVEAAGRLSDYGMGSNAWIAFVIGVRCRPDAHSRVSEK